MNENIIKDIVRRLTRLEKAVFSNGNKIIKKPEEKNFVGPTGGIHLLISQGTFSKKKGLSETRNELAKKGYHYSLQAVQMALSRLSKSGGQLVSLKESGRKLYVKRK